MKPDDDTSDYLPALPPEDRWFEDDADPYPTQPADDRTQEAD